MHVLRTKFAALIAACSLAVALPACGDDGKGAGKEVKKGAKKVEKGAKKGAKKVEKGAKKGAREVKKEVK